MSDSLQPHGLQHVSLLCLPPSLGVCSDSSPLSDWFYLTNHFILCSPLFLLPSIFPSIRVFSNELAVHISYLKHWHFSLSISPSSEYSGLISCRIDWFDLLAVRDSQESLAPQSENIASSVLTLLHGPTLTSIHDYRKNHSFDHMHLCWHSGVSAF